MAEQTSQSGMILLDGILYFKGQTRDGDLIYFHAQDDQGVLLDSPFGSDEFCTQLFQN